MVASEAKLSLIALMVDSASRMLAIQIVAEGRDAVGAFDPAALVESAYLSAAAGIILVRTVSDATDPGFSAQEMAKALTLKGMAQSASIYLLDYFTLTSTGSDLAPSASHRDRHP